MSLAPIKKYFPLFLLITLIVTVIALQAYWLKTDRLIGPGVDEKNYFLLTAKFLLMLSSPGRQGLGDALIHLSFDGRPPLYQLVSVPFFLVFGRDMDAAVAVNFLFQVLLLVAVYNIGKHISNSKTGLLAAFLVSIYPPLVQLNRIYRPHYANAAAVALILWSLLALLTDRSVKKAWICALSITFGLYLHPTVAYTIWLPVLLSLGYGFFFQPGPARLPSLRDFPGWIKARLSAPIFLRGYLPAFGLALIAIAGWYLTFASGLLETRQAIISGEFSAFRDYEIFTRGLRLEEVSYFWWYLLTLPRAINWVLTGFFVVGAFYMIWRRKPLALLLVTAYLGAYLVFASSTSMTWLHFAQVLPVVSLLSAGWVGELESKPIQAGLVALLVAAGTFSIGYVNWGTVALNPIAITLGAPLNDKGACQTNDLVFCPNPPNQADWKISQIVATIVAEPGCQAGACRVLALYPFSFDFSPAAFGYYAITEAPQSPLEITNIGDVAFGIESFNFDALLNSEYIVYLDIKTPPASYKGVAVKFVQNPPDSFTRSHSQLAVFTLSNGRKAHLLKRTFPLSLPEAQDAVKVIELDSRYKFGQFRVLAPLYAGAEQYESALQAYLDAIRYEPGDAGLYLGLAGTYEALGQLDMAAGAYKKVVEIALGSEAALAAQAWLDAHP